MDGRERPARSGQDRFWREIDERRRTRTDPARRRRARWVGLVGFGIAAAMPFVLWHRVIGEIATEFSFDLEYLVSGWTWLALIMLGLAFSLPVAWSAGRDPSSRWYPRARNAYAGWGITLYLLGVALATQVVQIADGVSPS